MELETKFGLDSRVLIKSFYLNVFPKHSPLLITYAKAIAYEFISEMFTNPWPSQSALSWFGANLCPC
jgi:hypothetical protein